MGLFKSLFCFFFLKRKYKLINFNPFKQNYLSCTGVPVAQERINNFVV